MTIVQCLSELALIDALHPREANNPLIGGQMILR
jgi:hypothetical protein